MYFYIQTKTENTIDKIEDKKNPNIYTLHFQSIAESIRE